MVFSPQRVVERWFTSRSPHLLRIWLCNPQCANWESFKNWWSLVSNNEPPVRFRSGLRRVDGSAQMISCECNLYLGWGAILSLWSSQQFQCAKFMCCSANWWSRLNCINEYLCTSRLLKHPLPRKNFHRQACSPPLGRFFFKITCPQFHLQILLSSRLTPQSHPSGFFLQFLWQKSPLSFVTSGKLSLSWRPITLSLSVSLSLSHTHTHTHAHTLATARVCTDVCSCLKSCGVSSRRGVLRKSNMKQKRVRIAR